MARFFLGVFKPHIESLRDALHKVPDPRASNRTWPISTLLTLICMALLAGRKHLASIHRHVRSLVVVNKRSKTTQRGEKQGGKSQQATPRQGSGGEEETLSY